MEVKSGSNSAEKSHKTVDDDGGSPQNSNCLRIQQSKDVGILDGREEKFHAQSDLV
jgi:hypothetical protein